MRARNFLIIFFILIPSFFSYSLEKKSSQDFYEMGASSFRDGKKFEAVGFFRHTLHIDPTAFQAKKILNQMGFPVSFWWLIPYEFFLFLIFLSLIFIIFSLKKWKIFFFVFCAHLGIFYFIYRKLPRATVLKEVSVQNSPYQSADFVFSLDPGAWVIVRSSKEKKQWTRVFDFDKGSGWLPSSALLYIQ